MRQQLQDAVLTAYEDAKERVEEVGEDEFYANVLF